MGVRMKIPFFPNTGDGTHCFQAAMKMALAVHLPEREFSYEELDGISEKLPGKWTWPTAAMLWMIEHGLSLRLIEEFDYRAFVLRGESYLIERFGKEVGEAQIANSDIDRERDVARRFAEIAPLEYRIPDLADVQAELRRGSVVILNVNAAALHGVRGYSGHFIVVCDVDEQTVTLHDPGLPPSPSLRVPRGQFECGWAYPVARDKNMLSISR